MRFEGTEGWVHVSRGYIDAHPKSLLKSRIRPGELRLLEPGQVASGGLSTHAGSPAMLAQYLQARTGARVGLLAIQPGDTSQGTEFSPEVAATMRELIDMLPAITDS